LPFEPDGSAGERDGERIDAAGVEAGGAEDRHRDSAGRTEVDGVRIASRLDVDGDGEDRVRDLRHDDVNGPAAVLGLGRVPDGKVRGLGYPAYIGRPGGV